MICVVPNKYEFEGYVLDETHQTLFYQNLEIRLAKRNFEVLELLVKNAGSVVDKREFYETVWFDTFVEDGNLAVSISNLRRIFETYSGHSFIETYSRRGYKFNAQVKSIVTEKESLLAPFTTSATNSTEEIVKILIADDHPLFRRGLRSMIETDLGLKIIGEAENGQTALDLVEVLQPKIVILDLKMPVLDGIDTAKIIHRDYPNIQIICLTLELNQEIINLLKRSNVRGYLLKDNAVSEIIMCIKQVIDGRIFMSSEVLELFIKTD